MSKITVTNLTTENETSLELDLAAMLSSARQKLATFMKQNDVFLGMDGEQIASDAEKTTKLEAIERSGDPDAPRITIDQAAEIGSNPVAPSEGDPVAGNPKGGDPKGGEPKGGEPKGGEPKGGDPKKPEGGQHPLNEQPFSGDPLRPIQLPEYQWAEDHVGLTDGLTQDGEQVAGDKISQMKVGQVRKLLKANRINLNQENYGVVAGFVDNNGDLLRAPYDAVHCSEVEVTPADVERITSFSFQYDERVSRLHRSATHAGEANVGIPDFFRMKSSYRIAVATRSDNRAVAKNKSASHLIPKARVVFKDNKITLSNEFVRRIEDAVAVEDIRRRAEKLLTVLERYGQFFASDMLLGGRLNYWSDERLEDSYNAKEEQRAFRVAANARASIDKVPVEGGGSWEDGLSQEQKTVVIRQASSLEVKVVGGNEATVTPEKWVPTVAKYMNWKVIGFNKASLVPTIDYLTDATRAECIKALRSYFASHLQLHTTEIVGPTHAKAFGYDAGDVKRIVKIDINHGINIDGLRITYEMANGQHKQMPWVGDRRGENNDALGPLAFDEEITSVEIGADSSLLRRLAFKTSKGRRFPESPTAYYGRGQDAAALNYTTLAAPRVCGIVGHVGRVIDSLGLRYRELADGDNGPNSRQFLLAMEPQLFPLNLPSTIEMTVRGVLLAGGWRTDRELNITTTENKRNTLIVELAGHSNHGGDYLSGLTDEALVEKAAVIVYLKKAGIADRNWLQRHSFDQQRNLLIERIQSFTDEPVATLQALSNHELVRWASTITRDTAAVAATGA
jgi:hypothetical protein